MRNLSILMFVLFAINLHSQSQEVIDSLLLDSILFYDPSMYENKIDLVENRKDTLTSYFMNKNVQYEIYQVDNSKNIIVFDELENLLIIENEKSLKPNFLFLEFVGELGNKNSVEKYYLTKNSDVVTLFYKIKENKLNLSGVNIEMMDNSYIQYCYYNRK